MAAMTTYGKQQLLVLGTGLLTPPTLYLALFSDSGDPTTSPTELVVANYVRQAIPWYAVSADVVANSADVVFPGLGSGSFLGAQILDVASSGTAWAWMDQASSFTIPASTDLTFPAGTITMTRT